MPVPRRPYKYKLGGMLKAGAEAFATACANLKRHAKLNDMHAENDVIAYSAIWMPKRGTTFSNTVALGR